MPGNVMIDHVSVAVHDLDRSTHFYAAVRGTIGFAVLDVRPQTVGFGKTYPEFTPPSSAIPTATASRR